MSNEEFNNQGNNSNKNEEKEFVQFGSNMWHSIGATVTMTDHSRESNDEFAQREIFLEGKAGSVFEMLSGLKSDDKEALSRTFLAMSSSAECCNTIRQSRYFAVLVALIHGKEASDRVREQASKALYNIVQQSAENKQNRREAMVYKLITQLLQYCMSLKNDTTDALNAPTHLSDDVPTITQTVALLMKFSFNEEYRRAMCEFGALHTLAKLIETDHFVCHGNVLNLTSESIAIRRYAAMALTNLTFRDSNNKALLCSFEEFMEALVVQLQSPNEDLCQVTASVLRNLSWRADSCIKKVLCDIHAVTSLMKTALRLKKESTLKAVLSALWNLSAHSNLNKEDICRVDGAIEYLVKMLNYQAPSGTLVIVENVGGILRNISSLIARQDDNSHHRAIIRKHNCLYVLLRQLTSPSLTVVSNSCGTLWNLSARCAEDQRTLISLGAMDMLRSLTHSKHKMISMACAAALKNLMNARLDTDIDIDDDRICDSSLLISKRHAFEHEIDDRLRENNGTSSSSYKAVLASKSYVDEVYNFGESSPCHPIVDFADHSQRQDFKKEVNRSSMISSSRTESDSINFNFTEKENSDCNTRDSRNANSSSTAFIRSGVSTKNILSENKSSGNDYMAYHKHSNSSSSDDDLHNSKTNGFRKCEEPYNIDDSFSNYAETDLDQTTNFSLRFHEQGRPDAERNAIQKEEVVEDCITSHTVDVSSNENVPTVCATVCDETPLMFSRSSSLDSVDNCSPEVDDDHGSVASDFSHGVSGVISPSELPASPSETVPQSPRSDPRKIGSNPLTATAPPSTVPTTSCGVFEDTVTVFKDENTPLHFSVATSLSSLTFDEDASALAPTTVAAAVPHVTESSTLHSPKQRSIDRLSPTRRYQSPLQAETPITSPLKCETETSVLDYDDYNGGEKEDCVDVNLSPEEEQAVLDACIDQGMPTVHRKFKSKTSKVGPEFTMSDRYVNISQSTAINDSTINFCTEDTPISISHAASNSDLSLLCPSEDSFLQNSILPLSSCVDDHDIIDDLPDEEQEKLLNLCIATGQSLNFNAENNRIKTKSEENAHKSLYDGSSSYSSTLSEVTEDLPVEEDRTLLKDMTESANLVITCPNTDNDYSFSQDVDDGELSDNESEHLLNQCIALGIQNMKDSTDRTKDLSDLENIGPPSFLAEANLDNSLTYVEEITDYPPGANEVVTPKQRRNQSKDRYQTYTVKLSPTKPTSSILSENEEKVEPNKQHRTAEKDRFKTRTLSKGDFEEIAKSQKNWSPEFCKTNARVGEPSPLSDSEVLRYKGKIVKSAGRARSGIPIVKAKPVLSKIADHDNVKSTPPTELPIVSLQRQNTFTKDEPSSIPVRKNVLTNYSNDKKMKPSSPTDILSSQFRSGIPSRIKEPSPKVVSRIANSVADNSLDFAKNRWSVSENNLNSSGVSKTMSSTNLNISLNGSLPMNSTVGSKLSPSASQSALPVRKEWTTRNVGHSAVFKK